MANSGDSRRGNGIIDSAKNWHVYLAVLIVAGAIHLGCIISPPSLMDDVDAVQAQIARNMLTSGDWVTARLDGVAYLEKAPLIYWLIGGCYRVFGVHDWVARLPIALSSMALCWLTAGMGVWAFGKRAGFYAGVCMATCVGLFLFTRILIPDVMLTATVALAMWALLRALDEAEIHPRRWAMILAACLGIGLLLKSLIGVVFPLAAGALYLLVTGRLFSAEAWKRLRPLSGILTIVAIAAPWHILATIRNPPYFDTTLHSGPGQYHGFLWFFVINEQLLRFLNMRYPRDYNTVPRVYFWLFHLLWLFPWSVFFPGLVRLNFRATDRAGQMRLLALCWVGFILVFFTFSTTQEYYSMPCYPALALLIGSALSAGGGWVRWGNGIICGVSALIAVGLLALLFAVHGFSAPGDISAALMPHPGAYTLSLGHMEDLTLQSFGYLRLPLAIAACAFLVGALGTFRASVDRALVSAAIMMVLFLHAARSAMVVFDPYLSSRPLAEAILRAPQGTLIVDRHYYFFSSVFFYTNRTALLLNGKFNNLEYGAAAPDAPDVFIDNSQFKNLWSQPERYYIVASASARERFEGLVGSGQLNPVAFSGGKMVLTNHPLAEADNARVSGN